MKLPSKTLAVFAFPVLALILLTNCKDAKKDDQRNTDKPTAPSDDLSPDDFGPETSVKADALSFDHNNELYFEPGSCVPFDLIVTGGKDAYFASLDQATIISVSSTSNSTEFFSDNLCQNKSSEISIAKGSTYGSVFMREKNPGSLNLKAEVTKGSTLKPAEAKVVFAKATKLKFTLLNDRSFKVDRCEPISLALQSQDDKEVLTAAPTLTTLAVTTGAAKFYSSENCSGDSTLTKELSKGFSDTTIFVKATSSGPLTLQAQAPKESGYETATYTVNVDPKE
jgi:hypothetical protein